MCLHIKITQKARITKHLGIYLVTTIMNIFTAIFYHVTIYFKASSSMHIHFFTFDEFTLFTENLVFITTSCICFSDLVAVSPCAWPSVTLSGVSFSNASVFWLTEITTAPFGSCWTSLVFLKSNISWNKRSPQKSPKNANICVQLYIHSGSVFFPVHVNSFQNMLR